MAEVPGHLIDRFLTQRVTLLLKDSRQLSGQLVGADEHLNIVLDDAEETTAEVTRRLGRVVLRGSNVLALHSAGARPSRTGGP
jgi:small nuclear ribonucleoprotein